MRCCHHRAAPATAPPPSCQHRCAEQRHGTATTTATPPSCICRAVAATALPLPPRRRQAANATLLPPPHCCRRRAVAAAALPPPPCPCQAASCQVPIFFLGIAVTNTTLFKHHHVIFLGIKIIVSAEAVVRFRIEILKIIVVLIVIVHRHCCVEFFQYRYNSILFPSSLPHELNLIYSEYPVISFILVQL